MSQFLLCSKQLSAEAIKSQCGVDINQISSFNCIKPVKVSANTSYLVSSGQSGTDRSILGQLSPMPVAKELTQLSLSYGGDNVVALADMTAKLKEYNIGLMGTSTSFYANRIGGFVGSVKSYQGALMNYRKAVTGNSATKSTLKHQAHTAFLKMQRQFGNELKMVAGQAKARRGTALTNPNRAINIARSSRNVASLNVTNQIQANNLVKLSRQAKFLGNGLAIIDFGSRVGNIHNSYQAGGNWERELFIESSSFATSAITGAAVVNVGGAVLGFLMVATPIGWVGLIIGGAAVAGIAAYSSIRVNGAFKDNGGAWYDAIMTSLGSK